MPRTKNTRKHLAEAHYKQQLKRITARLIEISLKVDGYIYKHQPITTTNAQKYIQEVSSYKIHCKEDARSLQVIDKLTCQMKSIITEQEISNSDNIYEIIQNSCTRDYDRSPVYSLTGSNITDDIVEVPIFDTIELGETSKELELINLCDDDDENIATIINKEDPNLSKVKEMQKSLSTLSLKQAADPIHTNPVEIENYSQSILDVSLPLTEMIQHNTVSNDNNPGIQYKHNKIRDSVPNNTTENLNANETFINNVSKCDFKASASKFVITKNDKNNLNQIKPVKNKTNRKRKPKATTELSVDKKENNIKKRKPKKAVTIGITTVATTFEKNKTVTDKTKKQDSSLDIPKPSIKVNVPRSNDNNSITKVYNNEVIDDLSWIENIRYVREVSLDEFDPKLTYLDESFWDNCGLPDNWGDKDFMY